MTTHAKLSAQLLRDAATFFDNVATQNPSIQDQLTQNAEIYRQVANLVEEDPMGVVDTGQGN